MKQETENKLPADFKAKWVAALRSGEYKQGEAKMFNRITNTYCCLGVACLVAGMNTDKIDGVNYPYHSYDGLLPQMLVGVPTENEVVRELTYRNDGNFRKQESFESIADYIEANL